LIAKIQLQVAAHVLAGGLGGRPVEITVVGLGSGRGVPSSGNVHAWAQPVIEKKRRVPVILQLGSRSAPVIGCPEPEIKGVNGSTRCGLGLKPEIRPADRAADFLLRRRVWYRRQDLDRDLPILWDPLPKSPSRVKVANDSRLGLKRNGVKLRILNGMLRRRKNVVIVALGNGKIKMDRSLCEASLTRGEH
jgi:hypothetical protein